MKDKFKEMDVTITLTEDFERCDISWPQEIEPTALHLDFCSLGQFIVALSKIHEKMRTGKQR